MQWVESYRCSLKFPIPVMLQEQQQQDYNATYRSHCKLRTLCDRMYMWSHRL